jgi:hypothetical protein
LNKKNKKKGEEECKGRKSRVETWNGRGGARGEKENVRIKKRRRQIERNYKKEK